MSHHSASSSATFHKLVRECRSLLPAIRDRERVGVGEEVELRFEPELPWYVQSDAAWSLRYGGSWPYDTRGSVEPPFGNSTLFTAPERESSQIVQVKVRNALVNKKFEVVEPDGEYTSEIVDPQIYAPPVGAGMNVRVYFHPRDVSFYNVWIYEVPGPASNRKGYFETVDPPGHTTENGAGEWRKMEEDNSWGDTAAFYDVPLGVNGSYDWVIPVQLRVGTDGTIKDQWKTWVQSHTVSEGRRGTVEKLGLCADQTPLTYSEPCQ